MKLTIEGIKDRAAWEKAGIALPGYDVEKISEKAKEEPGWVHFGIGNIFRIFLGGIADRFAAAADGGHSAGSAGADRCTGSASRAGSTRAGRNRIPHADRLHVRPHGKAGRAL